MPGHAPFPDHQRVIRELRERVRRIETGATLTRPARRFLSGSGGPFIDLTAGLDDGPGDFFYEPFLRYMEVAGRRPATPAMVAGGVLQVVPVLLDFGLAPDSFPLGDAMDAGEKGYRLVDDGDEWTVQARVLLGPNPDVPFTRTVGAEVELTLTLTSGGRIFIPCGVTLDHRFSANARFSKAHYDVPTAADIARIEISGVASCYARFGDFDPGQDG